MGKLWALGLRTHGRLGKRGRKRRKSMGECQSYVLPMHGREWGKRKKRRDRVEKKILTD